jgi:cytochrome c oxidase subunit 2
LWVPFQPGKTFAALLAAIALASLALFLSHAWWMPPGAAWHASMVDRQFDWTLIDVGVAFAIAQLALAAFAWRFRAGSNSQAWRFQNGIRTAIIISVVFIGLELVSAATVGRSAWASMYSAPSNVNAIRVQAMGQQFAFYFRYPGPDGKFGPMHIDKIDASVGNYFGLDPAKDPASKDDRVSATLVLPVNRPVELLLGAQDVIHSFYVRELRIQQDMVPGMQVPVHFTPTRIGTYEIACTQLCGLGHYRMRAYLQVMSEENFQKWMRANKSIPPAVAGGPEPGKKPGAGN